MAGSTEANSTIKPDAEVYPLGQSRPPLGVDDLPEPEEVFKVSRLGPLQIIQFVIGPSLIALGISIGSGEWLLGPQAVGEFGFIGIGWVITVSAILQTFYNVEVSRYVVATGEVPIVGWGRVPPGWKFWIPFSLIVFYFAFIFGGWAASAGQGLFALIVGRVHQPDELEYTRLLAIGLLFVVFLICVVARKISRALELSNWVIVGLLLAILIVVDIAIVPPSVWWEGIRGLSPRQCHRRASPRPPSARWRGSRRWRPASTGTRWPTTGTTVTGWATGWASSPGCAVSGGSCSPSA